MASWQSGWPWTFTTWILRWACIVNCMCSPSTKAAQSASTWCRAWCSWARLTCIRSSSCPAYLSVASFRSQEYYWNCKPSKPIPRVINSQKSTLPHQLKNKISKTRWRQVRLMWFRDNPNWKYIKEKPKCWLISWNKGFSIDPNKTTPLITSTPILIMRVLVKGSFWMVRQIRSTYNLKRSSNSWNNKNSKITIFEVN